MCPSGPWLFPDLTRASPEGLLAAGGDLSAPTLLTAYGQGIFPWYGPDQPILWWTPDPRCVLFLDDLHISHSLAKRIRSGRFQVRADTAFPEVIAACAEARQASGTWLSPEMQAAYIHLHELGYAHSVETWQDQRLVGGLYGISLGRMFFGESMFSAERDASKVALSRLVGMLKQWRFRLVDCQVYSAHLASLGATEIPRSQFQQLLEQALTEPGHPGRWHFP